MNKSESIVKIAAALVKAQSAMGNAVKDAVNPFFKKNYADINSVREAVLPSLNANGISVIQPTCVIEGQDYVETVLLHESGEFISSFTKIITDKPNDAQRHGSGLSYARRYALSSIANIGTEDDDANKATGKVPLPVAIIHPAKKFTPTQKDLDRIDELAKSSTLDDNQKIQLTNRVANAASKKDIDTIIEGLLKVQSA